jgi:hypothetical protein
MVDETPDDAGLAADPGRAKRKPPTIDLQATDVSSEPPKTDAPEAPQAAPGPEPVGMTGSPSAAKSVSPWVVAPVSGAVAAVLVIAFCWMLGWPPAQPAAPELNASASDAATIARIDALDKSIAALRGELASIRGRTDKLAADLGDLKAAPRDSSAAAVDLSAIDERLTKLEHASQAQGAEIAQAGAKVADVTPADDVPLRRLVAAALLDVAVQHGDSYAAALATAKSLSPNPDQLKPLEQFAVTGVPNPGALDRELLTLVPKLSPAPPENTTTGTGIIGRLQAGASRLVRVERIDDAGTERGAVVARITAAALRNDFAEARRELNALPPAERAAAQSWLDKAAARDAALKASRQFADEAMAALAKPAQ